MSANTTQCHKYSEYEIRPINTTGLRLNSLDVLKPSCICNDLPE